MKRMGFYALFLGMLCGILSAHDVLAFTCAQASKALAQQRKLDAALEKKLSGSLAFLTSSSTKIYLQFGSHDSARAQAMRTLLALQKIPQIPSVAATLNRGNSSELIVVVELKSKSDFVRLFTAIKDIHFRKLDLPQKDDALFVENLLPREDESRVAKEFQSAFQKKFGNDLQISHFSLENDTISIEVMNMKGLQKIESQIGRSFYTSNGFGYNVDVEVVGSRG